MTRWLGLLALLLMPLPGCRVRDPTAAAPQPRFMPEEPQPGVLIVVEMEGPEGAAMADSARALETLIAHFDKGCAIAPATEYERGDLGGHSCGFYLAGKRDEGARAKFRSDAASFRGSVVWVGTGVESLGEEALAGLGVRPAPQEEPQAEAVEWTISYGEQQHVERVCVPAATVQEGARVWAGAVRAGDRRPFVVGDGALWYVASGPVLERERFWTTCVWADCLHEMLGEPHRDEPRRLVSVLGDVPVWAREEQVARAIRPMLEAGLPVGVMAWTHSRDVPLADRPAAVRGLRKAESLGAVVVLAAETGVDAREHLRLAWEVGIHPLAWSGPSDGDNPFRLRIAGPEESPPYCAGGVLPGPISISDAGYIAPQDARRLKMQEVVRDAVALASFGLWAPRDPFLGFVRGKEAGGWKVADLRDLGVRVEDTRRAMVSGKARVRTSSSGKVRKTVFGPQWQMEGAEILTGGDSDRQVSVPGRKIAMLEVVKDGPERAFITGVTLDPWAYSGTGMSSKKLAEMLARRYQRNGVNTVFLYAYNVDEGAAYRTRYQGATISDWGRQDLLADVLEACHARDIRVVAWLYSGRERGMWLQHPEWQERTKEGRPHNPLRLHAAYFLCPRNPEVRRWFVGLLRDLAQRYPTLDGIELCEPVVNWFGDQACYCEVCRREFAAAHPGEPSGGAVWRRFRAEGLTEFMSQCFAAISEEGVDTYVMTISDAWDNGAILSPRRQAEESGFDLEALLDGSHAPDWVNYEVIWQQWAALYGTEVFNADWAEETARRLVRRTDGRARVVLHVESTDFGSQHMTPDKIAETMERVVLSQPDGLECYHSAAIDRKGAWGVLKRVYEGLP